MKRTIIGLLSAMVIASFSHFAQAELVHHWKFDGDAKDSVTGIKAKIVGRQTWGADRYRGKAKAIHLNGFRNYVVLGKAADLSFGNGVKDRPFTFSWWQKTEILPRMHKYPGIGVLTKQGEYSIRGSNAFRVNFHDGGGNLSLTTPVSIDWKQNKWSHIVMTYDGSSSIDGMKFYQDGKPVYAGSEHAESYVAMNNKGAPLILGAIGPEMIFKGEIDDLMIYNHVLKPKEVLQLFQDYSLASAGKDFATEIAIKNMSKVSIDGKLDEKAWAKLQCLALVCSTNPNKKSFPASFSIGHDANNLYFAFRLNNSKIDNAKRFVDISILSDGTQFPVLFEIDIQKRKMRTQDAYINKYFSFAISEDATGGLNVEAAIPLSILPMSKLSLSPWKIAVRMVSLLPDGTRAVYQYSAQSFKERYTGTIQHMGRFSNTNILVPYLLNLHLKKTFLSVKKGRQYCSVKLNIDNYAKPRTLNVIATLKLNDTINSLSSKTLLASGENTVDIHIPVTVTGKGRLNLRVEDTSGHQLLTSTFTVVLDPPLHAVLITPKYHKSVFFGQKLKNIVVDLMTDALDNYQNYNYNISLVSSSKTFWSTEKKLTGKTMRVLIPVPVKDGKYTLVSKLIYSPAKKFVAESRETLHKLPFRKGQVYFDANHVCYIDNKVFMPFGIFGDCGAEPPLQKNSWSVIDPKGIWDAADWGIDSCENGGASYLDEAAAAGLKCFVMPFPATPGFPLPMIGRTIKSYTKKQKQAIRERVRKYRKHPALLGWYIGNEPSVGQISSEVLKEVADIVREEDPYHPTLMVNHQTSAIEYYANTASLLMPDPYPEYGTNGTGDLDLVTRMVSTAITASKGKMPVWVLMQADNKKLHFGIPARAPEFVELRNELYQAVIAGAKGFFWYSRLWIEPHVIHSLSFLKREARLLQGVILFGKADSSIHIGRMTHFHSVCKRLNKDVFFFAVNSSRRKRMVTIKVDNPAIAKLHVLSENRSVVVKNGQFTDVFKPYVTHIYTTSKNAASQLSIRNIRNKIKTDCRRTQIKPGNLAHVSKGTKVTASWKAKYTRRPKQVSMIDGIKETSCWSQAELPCSIEINFVKSMTFNTVVVDSNIAACDIEVYRNRTWQKIVAKKSLTSVANAPRRSIQTLTFPATSSNKIRIVSRAVNGRNPDLAATTEIWEVEVYNKK